MNTTKKHLESDKTYVELNIVPAAGAAARIIKRVESKMKPFDLEKKRRAARTIQNMKKIYITH